VILALEYHRSPGRYLASRGLTTVNAGRWMTGAISSNLSPLRLVNRDAPPLPGAGWTRVAPLLSGICGSDLALLTGRASPYLGPLTSMPFVPGHEVVGETLDELPKIPKGTRVVLDPVLSCAPRGTAPCRWCAEGEQNRCDHITTGALSAGLQTGFCGDTGGGWSWQFVAHADQLHPVPESLPNERAILVEPLACAVHSVRRVDVPQGASVVIVGAGTVGLLTLLAVRELTPAGPVYLMAKHAHQRSRAKDLEATALIDPGRGVRALRRVTTARMHVPEHGSGFLLGGVDLAFECSGTPGGLNTALRLVRAGGTVVVSGMPAGGVDLTPLWYRELRLIGAYASRSGSPDGPASSNGSGPDTATSPRPGGAGRADFDTAIRLAGSPVLDGYVDTRYPLGRWREALNHAANAGQLGTVKVAFDLTRR
jgi:threonine dehydrogenase-like Zn-dependent dehydrogenase